jgi:hypothetical protein
MNYSEDETLRILKKIPYNDLEDILESMAEDEFDKIVHIPSVRGDFLHRYGWTLEEINTEHIKRHGEL